VLAYSLTTVHNSFTHFSKNSSGSSGSGSSGSGNEKIVSKYYAQSIVSAAYKYAIVSPVEVRRFKV